jgi:hypothetical protein
MRYAIPSEQYGQPCVDICNGETPFPEGAVWPVTLDMDGTQMLIADGVLREKTAEEKAAFDAAKAVYESQAEIQRQLAKPLKLKAVENRFLALCDQLTGGTEHTKLGFDVLEAIVGQIADQNTKVMVAIELLAIDAEAKREGGNLWWDDCVWHQEIV